MLGYRNNFQESRPRFKFSQYFFFLLWWLPIPGSYHNNEWHLLLDSPPQGSQHLCSPVQTVDWSQVFKQIEPAEYPWLGRTESGRVSSARLTGLHWASEVSLLALSSQQTGLWALELLIYKPLAAPVTVNVLPDKTRQAKPVEVSPSVWNNWCSEWTAIDTSHVVRLSLSSLLSAASPVS